MKSLEVLFRFKRKLQAWYSDTDLKIVITDYSAAESKVEGDKLYHYPETFEVKIENQNNHFYSFRTSDARFIGVGQDLVYSKGLTAAQLYKQMALEAKARRERLSNKVVN